MLRPSSSKALPIEPKIRCNPRRDDRGVPMPAAAHPAKRSNLRLGKFYRAKALAALARARHARWIGREGAVAVLLATALQWRRFSNRWVRRAQAGRRAMNNNMRTAAAIREDRCNSG
jgi:hypothetical protein